jgi:hypothetical protein
MIKNGIEKFIQNKRSFRIFCLGFFVLFLLVGSFYIASDNFLVSGQTVDQVKLEELNKQIEEYESQIARLNSEANTLSNQIAQYDVQIKLTSLKITQTEEKILLLGGRITQLEGSLTALSRAFTSRVVETYKISRLHEPFLMLITSPDLASAFSSFHYLQKIQEADSDLLVRLGDAQGTYEDEKTSQENLQKELQSQQRVLGAQKTAKNTLLTQTKNDEKRYQQLLSEAKAQLAAFRRFVTSQGGATILTGQTKCDSWGCYYNQRDSGWGNLAIGGSNSSMAEYGCLITSMAMITTYYGKSLKPSDISTTSSVFFGNTAYMVQGSWSVNGVSTNRTRVCSNCGQSNVIQRIDSEVTAGRPVVVGLYGGPDHFIVIKAKEGNEYIMNDPFLENGGNRKFSEKYSIGDIKTVDYVTVN